ncbi:urease subunit beta [Vibrio rotiferianus]|uniref:urease subunit beta n=1 Tax=Vibrio rotiferianus TaxID=190895 RepID=UPI00111002E8|nr:urease subunit beta [Vibrio rotiferianus]TMX43932.1 urease subunit beta [Vibrio rotiferianus]TMX61318.1 urease subunit beta [Vibrio rotiferianus]TMX69533.1 urease subunit beta [Vibrio rotiferianus]
MFAGEYQLKADDIELCTDRTTIPVKVSNTGDRPVQVGSHYHFSEANRALSFDRELAYGHRLAIAAGMSIRFEPGQTREVELIPFAGLRQVYGFRGDVMGSLDNNSK